MRKTNTDELAEVTWSSPKGRYAEAGKQVSEALGRRPTSTDLLERHPFDVEILRVPPGVSPYPFHSHAQQWEFYHVISGQGQVRDDEGLTPIVAGDASLFKPGEAHELINDGSSDLIVYVIADNPLFESSFYPHSNRWIVRSPMRQIVRAVDVDYYDGEE